MIIITLEDRNRPISQWAKPSSRTVLIDEQSNHCNIIQLLETISRHRGGKPNFQYVLSHWITLLSPE